MDPRNRTTGYKIIVNMVYLNKRKQEEKTMARRNSYTPEFKTKVVLEVLQGERELGELAAEYDINPNMLRNWKREFMENSSRAFDESRQAKQARRKEAELEKKQAQMLRTIGQLTLERDFLQECFRTIGKPIPKLPEN